MQNECALRHYTKLICYLNKCSHVHRGLVLVFNMTVQTLHYFQYFIAVILLRLSERQTKIIQNYFIVTA